MPIKYNQPTPKPTAKMSAVGIASAVVAGVVALLAAFGVIVPEGLTQQAEAAVAAVITVIAFLEAAIAFAAGYFKKSEKDV